MFSINLERVNENQHWISRVLLNRFRIQGLPFRCFQIKTGEWISKSIDRACAWPGYNQLITGEHTDNALESALSKVESGLRRTFRALDQISEGRSAELLEPVFRNLCEYCAFLKLISPISKPGAIASFVIQINMELERGECSLLRDLKIPEKVLRIWRSEFAAERRIIVEGENLLQVLYRFQFRRCFPFDLAQFLITKWTITKSPVEFPISDVGLVPVYSSDLRANHYLLPIGPHIALEGIFFSDLSKNAHRTRIGFLDLTEDEAEYRFNCLCASAVEEIICRREMPNIKEAIGRAGANGISFNKITNKPGIVSAGLTKIENSDLTFRAVSLSDYRQFVHGYVKPSTSQTIGVA